MPTPTGGTTAIVLAVGDGWYAGIKGSDWLRLAPTLIGATMFSPDDESGIVRAEAAVMAACLTSERLTLVLVPRDPTA